MFNNKLQVALSLTKRGWKGGDKCCVCGKVESVDHIFFQCTLAHFVWNVIKEVFKLERMPRSLEDFSEMWLLGKGPMPIRLMMFLFAGFTWALWTTRNKMAIEKRVPKAPADIIFVALSWLQKWCIMLKEADRERILQTRDDIMKWMETFKPSLFF